LVDMSPWALSLGISNEGIISRGSAAGVLRSARTSFKELRLLRSREPKWNIGIRKNRNYWITTPERTIVDCLIHRGRIGNQVALEALKRAVSQKKVKLGDVLDMAKKMGVEHRILPYIETLSS